MTTNKINDQVQDAFAQAQKLGQQAQDAVSKAFANAQPELVQAQEYFQNTFQQVQENIAEVQALATKQPFNPFELQKVFMAQQLNFIKQANRQFEGQLEKAQQQFTEFGEKLNSAVKK